LKLFALTSRLPWPLDKGDKLRAYHQLRELSKDHEVHLFCLVQEAPSDETMEALAQVTKRTHWVKMRPWVRFARMGWSLFSTRPFQVHWFYQRHAAQVLSKLLAEEQPDVIYCQLIRMAEYVKDHHEFPRVLDYMDALSAGMMRRSKLTPFPLQWFFHAEASRLRKYEATTFDYFDAHSIISVADRKLIAHPERKAIQVVPNGVDNIYFEPLKDGPPKDTRPTVLFTGNMSYPPNVDAAIRLAQEVLPQTATSGIKLIIAGTKPSRRVKQLATTHIEVTGWIADMRTAYEQADLFVAPLRIGTGQQNKSLEAMACGIPCITTSHVLAGFLDPGNGILPPPLQIADSPEQMAAAIDDLMQSPEKRNAIGQESREWVQKNSSWAAHTAKLTSTFVHSTQHQSSMHHGKT
jgi:sugar transferase (PEP-CTERM/EpsH1 system associated)